MLGLCFSADQSNRDPASVPMYETLPTENYETITTAGYPQSRSTADATPYLTVPTMPTENDPQYHIADAGQYLTVLSEEQVENKAEYEKISASNAAQYEQLSGIEMCRTSDGAPMSQHYTALIKQS